MTEDSPQAAPTSNEAPPANEGGTPAQEGQPVKTSADPVPQKPVEQPNAYGKLQSELSSKDREIRNLKKQVGKLEGVIDEVDGIDSLREEVKGAKEVIFQSQATQARANLIQKEFPQLKGKEDFIQLDTEENMRKYAEHMVKEFGLEGGTPSGTTEDTHKSEAGPTFSATLERLAQLPLAQLKEELKKFPPETKEKLYRELMARGMSGF